MTKKHEKQNQESPQSATTSEDEMVPITKAQKRIERQERRAQKRKEREEKRKARKSWHPLNILRGIGLFFLTIIKIMFFPYIYAFWKIRDSLKFLSRNDVEDLDQDLISQEDGDEIPPGYLDEKGFLRSLPMFYFIAGTLGGIIAIFVSFPFMTELWLKVKKFFINFNWATFWVDIKDILKTIFVDGIWFAMKVVGFWIRDATVFLFTGGRFWIPLTVLIVLGIGITIIAVIFSEVDFSGKFIKKIKAFFKAIFTFPRILWRGMKKGYYLLQLGISRFTFGEKKLKFFQKRFFYRVVIYSTVTTLWIIVSVFITVIVTEHYSIPVNHKLVYPIGAVIVGIFNGVFLLSFLSWFVGVLSKDKYIIDLESYHNYEEMKRIEQEKKKLQRLERKKA